MIPSTIAGPQARAVPADAGAGPDERRQGLARLRAPRRVVVWTGSVLALGLVFVIGHPLGVALAVLAMCLMFASILAPEARPSAMSVTSLLPAGFILVCVSSLVAGLSAGVVGTQVWTSRGTSLVSLTVLVILTGIGAWRRGGSVVVVGRDAPAALALLTLLAFFVSVITLQPFAWWSRVVGGGTDFLRHLGMIRDVRELGLIEPGAASYPSSFHSVSAWFLGAMGVPADADLLWQAIQPIAYLMLGLMLTAVVASGGRAAHLTTGSWRAAAGSGVVAAVIFVQTAWFSIFLGYGSVMNMVVAICLLGLLVTGLGEGAYRTGSGALVCAGALVVTANSWQLLLPVVGLGALPWIAHFLRSGLRRPELWVFWVGGALLSVHGLLAVGGPARIALADVVTLSNLFRPDWWWGAALALAGVVMAGAWRRGSRAWAMTSVGLVGGAVGMTAFLVRTTGSTWELMLYYPVKAMWTSLVVVVPLASAGAATLVVLGWRLAGRRSSTVGLATKATVALAIGITCLAVAGRGAAFPPHLAGIASARSALPNWSMAVVSELRDVPIRQEAREGAVVFGLLPSGTASDVRSGFVGTVDYMAMEALAHLGVEGALFAPVKPALVSRDMTQVCRYLMDHPDSLRVTGPNPATGPRWILDAGCPEDVVKPGAWITLQLDGAWLENSPWADGEWVFPTTAEVRGDSAQSSA
jgi:hypothetical protein